MGLDSVELVMAWEESFDITISDAEASSLHTPRLATDLIYRKLSSAKSSDPGPCLTQRIFYRLRSSLQRAFAVRRKEIRPQSSLYELLPAGNRREQWQTLREQVGTPGFPKLFLRRLPRGCDTVGGFARRLATRQPRAYRGADEPWTRPQVRAVIREIIVEQLGIPEFSDDADFVRDLRVD